MYISDLDGIGVGQIHFVRLYQDFIICSAFSKSLLPKNNNKSHDYKKALYKDFYNLLLCNWYWHFSLPEKTKIQINYL